ncbi:MAG: BON domain-containing protein [Gammaproteobacteria bacterium]|nr:BON domain-containing protein [Gammaproteobacteria bacterium]MDD9851523.1 BON domain-containing protein [Gammaproteobacteria bacterium]MDD9870869.1 BON domain-containing protein [Gammaproteobacteria bacterium]
MRVLPLAISASALLLSGCPAVFVVGGVGAATAGVVDISSDHRSIGRHVDDSAIELRAGTMLAKEESLDDARISVTSVNGITLLTGEAPDDAARLRAVALVRDLAEVRRVLDKITVGPRLSSSRVAAEVALAVKCKAKIIKDAGRAALNVNVVAHGGTVYLMGVISRAEGDAAAEAIRTLGGVARIIKVFEYVEEQT